MSIQRCLQREGLEARVGWGAMARRVVIVGAGPGGLAAAMLLARAGAAVTVLERKDRVGGRSSAIEIDGFRFDMGPTFFLYPRVLEDIFAACGRRLADEVDLVRLDPQYRLVFEGSGSLDATSDPERMREAISRLAPGDGERFDDFMRENRAKLAAFRPVLESPFNGLGDLVSPGMLKSLPLMRPLKTVDRDLMRYFKDPRIRLAFSFQSKYLGMSPYKCPSLFTILSFLEYEYGVFHPKGGCAAVVEAMARVAHEMGVEIRLGEPVEQLAFEGRKPIAAETRAGRYPCDSLVVNADFAQAMTRLVPDRLRRRWTDAKIASKRYSCSTFMMYLGIEGRIPDLAHHTVFLSRDYVRNLAEIEEAKAPPTNPSIYVQNAGVTDPSLAPEGHSTLYVLVPVGNLEGGIDWARETPAFRRAVYKRLAEYGLGDVEARVKVEKILTPAGWAEDMAIYRGATFNLAHTLDQMLCFRPRNRFEDLDGVYLVGGGTHPGSGLPVIFESARITSRLMIEDMGLAPLAMGHLPNPAPAMAEA